VIDQPVHRDLACACGARVEPAVRPWRLPQSFAHYEATGALSLARWLVRSLWLGGERGDHWSLGISFNMAKVFEAAFARLLKPGYPEIETQASILLTLENSQPIELRPDVVIPQASGRLLVLDTKWKELVADHGSSTGERVESLEHRTAGGLKLRIKTADVSQVLSYAYLRREQEVRRGSLPPPVVGALVYPVLTAEAPIEILGSGLGGDLRLFLAPWRVGPDDLEPAQVVIARLQQKAGTSRSEVDSAR